MKISDPRSLPVTYWARRRSSPNTSTVAASTSAALADAASSDVPGSNERSINMASASSAGGNTLNPIAPAIENDDATMASDPTTRAAPTATPLAPWLDGYSASLPNHRASDCCPRMNALCVVLPRRRNGRATAGMKTTENTNDSSSVIITVAGIARMNAPRMPVTNSRGANTRTVVRVPDIDAEPTRLMAVRTTSIGWTRSSRLASSDSEITIASSTNRPRVRISAKSVIVLSE